MAKLPQLSGQQLVKILCKYYHYTYKQTRGSHIILIKEEPIKICISVPNHDELAKGTLLGILHKANITKESLQEKL
ncbi:MAG: type II toxin-antitoxin system HicA family toxin [Nanoarchaeota archaeon]|nr:type II toxin-antitoxin system HicA family toxin [Nanoarchaeota archaeon]